MNKYELAVVLNAKIEDEERAAALEKVKNYITRFGGTITNIDEWGKKRLAYSINREDFAVYVYFEVKLPAEAPLKISNVLNITDEVLRYLLVKADEKARLALAEQRQRDEEAERTANEEATDEQ